MGAFFQQDAAGHNKWGESRSRALLIALGAHRLALIQVTGFTHWALLRPDETSVEVVRANGERVSGPTGTHHPVTTVAVRRVLCRTRHAMADRCYLDLSSVNVFAPAGQVRPLLLQRTGAP